MIERICHTPVDDGVSQVWHAIMIKPPHDEVSAEEVAELKATAELFKGGFAQDFEIWANKQPCIQPMQLPTDGSFRKVRQWYRQYYSPRAKSQEILVGVEGVYTVPGYPGMPVAEFDAWLQDADTKKYCKI
jgi:3-ketosteroid 9alpha-monooxygenase subunit A